MRYRKKRRGGGLVEWLPAVVVVVPVLALLRGGMCLGVLFMDCRHAVMDSIVKRVVVRSSERRRVMYGPVCKGYV